MTDILGILNKRAKEVSGSYGRDAFILRGVWRTNYILRLGERASVFNLHYILAQTLEQGCSYYEPQMEEPQLSEGLLGRNVLELTSEHRSLKIAALDAVFASTCLRDLPDKTYDIEGTNIEKAERRAEIICSGALSILNGKSPKKGNKLKVVNVGVVGNILAILSGHEELEIRAVDFYQGVVGGAVHGVTVEHASGSFFGSRTLELIKDSDLVIMTGMTLANNTLDAILNTARENDTALVMFAETGAHFAREYCKMGVDVVFGEPFPFYLTSAGTTRVNAYWREDHRSQGITGVKP